MEIMNKEEIKIVKNSTIYEIRLLVDADKKKITQKKKSCNCWTLSREQKKLNKFYIKSLIGRLATTYLII